MLLFLFLSIKCVFIYVHTFESTEQKTIHNTDLTRALKNIRGVSMTKHSFVLLFTFASLLCNVIKVAFCVHI